MRKKFLYPTLVLALACGLFTAPCTFAATRSTCPKKVLDTGTIEGIFLGVECGDFCHAGVKLANGEEFYLLASEEAVKKAFGAGTGQRVSIQYQLEQFWNEFAGDCDRTEVFVSGKKLAK